MLVRRVVSRGASWRTIRTTANGALLFLIAPSASSTFARSLTAFVNTHHSFSSSPVRHTGMSSFSTPEGVLETAENVSIPGLKLPKSSALNLGYNNEDVAVEMYLLDRLKKQSNLNVMMVTGGADNFMTVLADPRVSNLTLVDTSAVQNALAQLKLALCCSNLTNQEILTFMGTYKQDQPTQYDGMNRMQVYETKIKPQLPPQVAQTLQDTLSMELELGYNFFGGLEKQNRLVNHVLETKGGFAMADLWNQTCDMDALNKFCNDADSIHIDDYLVAVGMKGKLPPHVEASITKSLTEGGGLAKLVEGHWRICKDGIQNHLAHMTFFHCYSDDYMPDWLARRDEIKPILEKKRDCIKFVTGPATDVPCGENDAKYDLISPSNIFDWTPMEKKSQDVATICDKYLSKDGLFMLRMAFGGASTLVDGCPDLEECPEISETNLANIETAPFFHGIQDGMVAVQFVRK